MFLALSLSFLSPPPPPICLFSCFYHSPINFAASAQLKFSSSQSTYTLSLLCRSCVLHACTGYRVSLLTEVISMRFGFCTHTSQHDGSRLCWWSQSEFVCVRAYVCADAAWWDLSLLMKLQPESLQTFPHYHSRDEWTALKGDVRQEGREVSHSGSESQDYVKTKIICSHSNLFLKIAWSERDRIWSPVVIVTRVFQHTSLSASLQSDIAVVRTEKMIH